jgi:hypothetical protein
MRVPNGDSFHSGHSFHWGDCFIRFNGGIGGNGSLGAKTPNDSALSRSRDAHLAVILVRSSSIRQLVTEKQ